LYFSPTTEQANLSGRSVKQNAEFHPFPKKLGLKIICPKKLSQKKGKVPGKKHTAPLFCPPCPKTPPFHFLTPKTPTTTKTGPTCENSARKVLVDQPFLVVSNPENLERNLFGILLGRGWGDHLFVMGQSFGIVPKKPEQPLEQLIMGFFNCLTF